jgi:hypothetical protein
LEKSLLALAIFGIFQKAKKRLPATVSKLSSARFEILPKRLGNNDVLNSRGARGVANLPQHGQGLHQWANHSNSVFSTCFGNCPSLNRRGRLKNCKAGEAKTFDVEYFFKCQVSI